jgi:hypothetical protein
VTREEVLAVLSDGEGHYLPPGAIEVLVAGGFAEWLEASTFELGIEQKLRGCRPARITEAGRRRALKGTTMFAATVTE